MDPRRSAVHCHRTLAHGRRRPCVANDGLGGAVPRSRARPRAIRDHPRGRYRRAADSAAAYPRRETRKATAQSIRSDPRAPDGGIRSLRSLLRALLALPWSGVESHPELAALGILRTHDEHQSTTLPPGCARSLRRIRQSELPDAHRERAFAACEVASRLNLRRALRNGTVGIEHSITLRSRERLSLPVSRWQSRRRTHYRTLTLATSAAAFLEPLLERAGAGVRTVPVAAADARVAVHTALHLAPIAADPEIRSSRRTVHCSTVASERPGWS